MLALLTATAALLTVCSSIIDPRSVLDSLPTYRNYSQMRKAYFDIVRDYPYGDADYHCAAMEPTLGGPKDAHHLRPADIRVIAAIGDSLTAGREALTEATVDFGSEYRGVAFDAGGDGGLANRTTLPNILSRFSPSLRGASHGVFAFNNAQLSIDFNVAVSGAHSTDLMDQVDELERRLRSVKAGVNFEEDWKLVTMFIGSNDLCSACTDNSTDLSPDAYVGRVRAALEALRARIPRVFINLLPPFNVFAIRETHESAPFCAQFHRLACPSLFVLSPEEGAQLFDRYSGGLSDLPGLLNTPGFAVTVNPALTMRRLPQIWGTPHYALLAADCFHFSGFTHDVAAKIVWRNLMRPESERADANDFASLELQSVACPEEACPYLRSALTDCASSTAPAPRLLAHPASFEGGYGSRPGAVLAVFGIIVGCGALAAGTVATIVRFRRRYKRRLSERTPLLTAHYYESIF